MIDPHTDRQRWIDNERLLYGAQNVGVARKFDTVVKGMERLGWKPKIMEVRRFRARQLWLFIRRLTKTMKGKHLSGLAMDVIDARYKWADTPVEFMVDLAILAREQGLTTGLLWDLKGTERSEREEVLASALAGWTSPEINSMWHDAKAHLVRLLKRKRGWDPCHVEVV